MCSTYEIVIDSSFPGQPWISHGSAGEDQQHFRVCGMKNILNLTLVLVWFAVIILFYLAIAEIEKRKTAVQREREKKTNHTFEVNTLLWTDFDINEMTNAEMIPSPCCTLSGVCLHFFLLFCFMQVITKFKQLQNNHHCGCKVLQVLCFVLSCIT